MIVISDDGRRVVDESTGNTRLPSYTKIRFNPRTFSAISSSSTIGGPGMWISSRSTGSATRQRISGKTCEGMPKVICSRPHAIVTPMPGTKRIVPFEPYLLPFIIVQSGEREFTVGSEQMLWVKGSCFSTKPQAYPKDKCIHVIWNNTADTPPGVPTSEDLWFNPATYVLDRYQVAEEASIDRLICVDANTCRDPNGTKVQQPFATLRASLPGNPTPGGRSRTLR